MTAARNPWLKRFAGAARPAELLVCLPHAGGAASAYRRWREHLPPEVELLAVQYPGREDRMDEPPVTDLAELAELLLAAIAPALDRPFTVFGHSLGALVGYELVRRLADAGGPLPRLLVVSSQFPPGELPDRGIRLRDDAGVLAEVDRLSGDAGALLRTEELRAFVAGLVRADFEAAETYCPEVTALPVPLAAFCGDADPAVAEQAVLGWSKVAERDFRRLTFPGGHFYLRDQLEPAIAAIGRVLTELRGAGAR